MTESNPTPEKDSRKYMRNTLAWAVGIAVVVALNFFLFRNFLSDSSHDQDSSAPNGEFVAKKGAVAPDFEIEEYEGKPVKLSSFKSKVTLINFWATWCASCVIEIPSILKLRDEFKDKGLQVIFVSVDEDPEEVLPEKLIELKLGRPTYVDRDQNLSELFEVSAIPLTVIFNQKREILYFEPGERDWHSKEVRDQIKRWLSE